VTAPFHDHERNDRLEVIAMDAQNASAADMFSVVFASGQGHVTAAQARIRVGFGIDVDTDGGAFLNFRLVTGGAGSIPRPGHHPSLLTSSA